MAMHKFACDSSALREIFVYVLGMKKMLNLLLQQY